MASDMFGRDKTPPMNEALGDLEATQKAVREANAREAAAKEAIRAGYTDRVVVFVDLVGSTAFKLEHEADPAVWLYRVKAFCDFVRRVIEDCGGNVVKYIGDEVMGIFDRKDTMVEDAMNFVSRVGKMQGNLTELTHAPTEVKIALDFGEVMLLTFEGHEEADPQGTPVDRCARISKYAAAGKVVSSRDFVDQCPPESKGNWNEAGSAPLKGLGEITVYQLGPVTIEVYETTTMRTSQYNELVAANKMLTSNNAELSEMNNRLRQRVAALGEKPDPANIPQDDDQEEQAAWNEISEEIEKLKTVLRKVSASKQYAEALFLFRKGEGLDGSVSTGAEIDTSLTKRGLVEPIGDGSAILMIEPRKRWNMEAIGLMDGIEELLKSYVEDFGENPEDDFDYSLSDVDFWKEKVGYDVE